MSHFCVLIKKVLAIEPHPNADKIEFAIIDGYRSLVMKNTLRPGDLVAYIPESSIVPQWLLQHMKFWDYEKNIGTLAGAEGNRVHAVKLRGEISQGICFPTEPFYPEMNETPYNYKDCEGCYLFSKVTGESKYSKIKEGDDVTEFLGITKYIPEIPVCMNGELFVVDREYTIGFDVEDWKAHPDTFKDGEEVIFTEKLHGTFTCITILPNGVSLPEAFGVKKNILVSSKSLGERCMVFTNNEANVNNLYVRATRELIKNIGAGKWNNEIPLFLMGETFGPGVQDLHYNGELGFRLFAVAEGFRGFAKFCDYDEMVIIAKIYNIEMVPFLYRGPFSVKTMQEYTSGDTTLGGKHMREGLVITPVEERTNSQIGRVCLKSVSDAYIGRKGGTEYN